jgi:hypothetical protein
MHPQNHRDAIQAGREDDSGQAEEECRGRKAANGDEDSEGERRTAKDLRRQ